MGAQVSPVRPARYRVLLVVFSVLAALLMVAVAPAAGVFADPIDFTGTLAPAVTGDDVLGTAFNWLLAFSVLVLASMGMRMAPRIVRSMKGMM